MPRRDVRMESEAHPDRRGDVVRRQRRPAQRPVAEVALLVLLQESEQKNRHDDGGKGLRGRCDDGDEIELWHWAIRFCALPTMNAM